MAASSIKKLKVYALAYDLESSVYTLANKLTTEEFYPLQNSLRRSSAGVAHYIYESYHYRSATLKIESLRLAITECERVKKLLLDFSGAKHGDTTELVEQYTVVIKQCWGLLKYIRAQRDQQQAKQATAAADELVASRK